MDPHRHVGGGAADRRGRRHRGHCGSWRPPATAGQPRRGVALGAARTGSPDRLLTGAAGGLSTSFVGAWTAIGWAIDIGGDPTRPTLTGAQSRRGCSLPPPPTSWTSPGWQMGVPPRAARHHRPCTVRASRVTWTPRSRRASCGPCLVRRAAVLLRCCAPWQRARQWAGVGGSGVLDHGCRRPLQLRR